MMVSLKRQLTTKGTPGPAPSGSMARVSLTILVSPSTPSFFRNCAYDWQSGKISGERGRNFDFLVKGREIDLDGAKTSGWENWSSKEEQTMI